MSPTNDRRKQAVRIVQRDDIMDALATLISARGYAETTMNDLASTASVSKTTLYALFPSKEAAFVGLLERTTDRAFAHLEAARRATTGVQPWTERLRCIIAAYLDGVAREPTFVRVALIEADAVGDLVRRAREKGSERYARTVETMMQEVAEETGLQPLSWPLAIAVVGGLNELVVRAVGQGPDAIRALAEPTTELVVRLMRGGSKPVARA